MGMVHGDLRAANISVSANGTLVITNFGNSIIIKHIVEFINNTNGADVSIRWVASEPLSDQNPPTRMADVWALGMVVLVTCIGSVPYTGLHDAVVCTKITAQVLPERPKRHIPTGDKQADLLWSLLN
ncbi:kinase-like domain-containing protein [Rhizoctonia solani]|nr:kinase-like domain-containing protein [Rhizoctonia solani]